MKSPADADAGARRPAARTASASRLRCGIGSMSARTRSNSRSLDERATYEYPGTRVAVTGATGFIGAHVARLLAERGAEVRVTHRDPARLSRLGDVPVTPIEADVLDRAALRRAFRGARLVFHGAGVVATRPAAMVWKVNALGPRLPGEAAAAG